MLDFLKSLGWFKTFFYIIFPLVIAGISIASIVEGYPSEVKDILLAAGFINALIVVLVRANRNTK
jgi:hypothetical protein